MMLLWHFGRIIHLKFGFEKGGILNKIPFLQKALHGDFWKGITSFLLTSITLGG